MHKRSPHLQNKTKFAIISTLTVIITLTTISESYGYVEIPVTAQRNGKNYLDQTVGHGLGNLPNSPGNPFGPSFSWIAPGIKFGNSDAASMTMELTCPKGQQVALYLAGQGVPPPYTMTPGGQGGTDVLYYYIYQADGTTLWGDGKQTGSPITTTCTGESQQIQVVGKIVGPHCIPDPNKSTCQSRWNDCVRIENSPMNSCYELNPGAHNPGKANYQIGCANNPSGENECLNVFGSGGDREKKLNACHAGVTLLQSLNLCSGSLPSK